MKIAIIGYSGAGKSTLAKWLGEYYNADVLHLDSVHFTSGWVEQSNEEMISAVSQVLEKDSWVIDGNYSAVLYQKRMEEADKIIFLNFNRLNCLWRAYKRYRTYKGRTRPDMAEGCNEKLDLEFIRWILIGGRSKRAKKRYQNIINSYSNKAVVLKNQREVDRFMNEIRQC